MSIRTWVLSVFRGFFLYHQSSLEFRAKVLAPMVSACIDDISEYDFSTLKEIIKEIYPNDKKREDVLLQITKEYINIILRNPTVNYDELIRDILSEVKIKKELVKKINLEHLQKLIKENLPENKSLLQQRLYEFFESLKQTQ